MALTLAPHSHHLETFENIPKSRSLLKTVKSKFLRVRTGDDV